MLWNHSFLDVRLIKISSFQQILRESRSSLYNVIAPDEHTAWTYSLANCCPKTFFFQISKISYAYGWVLLYNVSLGTTSLNNVFVIESTSWHFVMRLSSVTIEWWYLQVILAVSIQQLHNTWRVTFPLIHIFSSGK